MVVQSIVILSLLITYALSAPTGCIESCISYVKQYQTQTSGGLSQTASHLQGLDYSKPGTWSEHNDYDIDNGHGKVHEERGQYVTGPKTVRYYRKNSSSSYSTGYPNGEILSDFEYQNNRHGIHLPNTQEVFNSHNTYNQMGNSESVAQHKYNKIQSQQHTRSSYTKGERLEDLGEYSGRSQVIPQSTSNLNTQILQEPYHFNGQHGNWSTVDSYKTDGGRGHVFEEEGQYVSGPQKVRYYKRNYTSSYSSSDGIPIPKITKIGMHDIHQKLEKIEKEIGQEFKHISTAEAVGSTNIGQAHIRSHDLSIDNMHNINNNNYRRQHNHRNSLPMTHNEEQHSSDIRNEHLPYRNPYQNTYGANSYSTYERHEEYAQKLQPTSQLINPTSGYTSVLNTGNSGYNRNIYSGSTSQQQTDKYQQAEILDAHQSRQIAQTQTFLDNLRNNAQSQSSRIQSGMQGVSHYKEHWNASHTKEVSIPQHTTDISHMNQHSLQYNNNQYDNRHNLHQGIQQQDSYLHQFNEDGFTHGKKMLDKLISGVDTVDCDYNSQYTESTSQYSRKYKRHAKYGKQDEVQQTQNKYINDDLTQQTSRKLEFGPDSQQSYQPWKPQGADQQLGDFTHETGKFDDFTQQTSGNLEFGQESEQSFPTWHPNVRDQKWGHLTQQTGSQPKDDLQKPAEKPKPRSRYSRRWSTVNTQVLNQDMYNINNQNNLNLNAGDTDAPNIYELPPQVNVEGDKDNIRRQSTRGDQGQDKDVSKKLSQQAGSSGYDVEGGNVDQVNWLHKSNDATVGLQWHYTYHPSDQRQFVQQTDQKNKEDLQQRSIQTQFSNLQQNPKQEEQIKYIVDNSDQQESHWQPQNYATEQGIKSVRKPFRYIQHENKLMSDQQKRENENLQKYVETASSEPKLQPRILEVYGGGQYDPTHSGDIYSGVTINPSATLPPTSNTDPWDIREKPEIMVTTTELTMPPLPVEPLNTNDTNEPPRPSSLWTRIGHKITTTFDKAKEKARNIFG